MPNFAAITIFRVALASLVVSLAWSRSPRYHAAALAVLWVAVIFITVPFALRIAEAAA